MLCLSFLLLIGLCGALGREKVRHTCNAYIAMSNNGSMEKIIIPLDQDVHVCGGKDDGWKLILQLLL